MTATERVNKDRKATGANAVSGLFACVCDTKFKRATIKAMYVEAQKALIIDFLSIESLLHTIFGFA